MSELSERLSEICDILKKEYYIGKDKPNLCNHCEDNCLGCSNKLYVKKYPQITPEIILKLIKILLNKGWIYSERPTEKSYLMTFDNDKLKEKIQVEEDCFDDCVIKLCTELAPEIKEEVQKMFKGE